jgi:hypothetical protein
LGFFEFVPSLRGLHLLIDLVHPIHGLGEPDLLAGAHQLDRIDLPACLSNDWIEFSYAIPELDDTSPLSMWRN